MNKEFRVRLAELPREELLSIIKDQDPELMKQVRRIEWVFENKMSHLTWEDGTQIESRPVPNDELALLIDEPFVPDKSLIRAGIDIDQQRQIHIASDPVLWSKHFLNATPRAYQIMMLRHPSLRKVLRAGRRLGKALAVDTPIPTPDGWKTMGELRQGDQVFDEQGKPCNVVYATDFQYNRTCYDVVFSDGSIITADADHLWTTHTKQYRKALGRADSPQSAPTTFTTEEIRATLRVGAKNEANHAIPTTEAVEYPKQNLPINPYTLGLWLGDGVSREASISIHEAEVASHLRADGYELTQWKDTNMYTIHGISAALHSLNLVNNKHIPEIYLTASIHQRKELLKGLMDSDGHVRKEDGYCEFAVKLEALANDVHELVASLGLRPTLRRDNAFLYGKDCGQRYRVGFTPRIFVFKLARKLFNQTITNGAKYRYIVDIRDRESVPVKCIEVDSPNRLYLVGKSYISTHNTWTMAVTLLHYSFTHNDGRCIVVAPMKSQAELIYQEIIRLTKKSDVVFNSMTRKVTSPQYMIEFSNNSTIRFFTSGIRSGGKADVVRGQEAHLIILDELDYMHGDDLESLYAMLQKTAEDQPDKLLMGASTPTGRREQFWAWCHSPRFKEFWFPSYVNPFFTKEAEEEFRSQYTEMGYRHEIEADWGEDVDGVYPRKYVDIAFANEGWPYRADLSSARSFFVIGIDWDKYGAGTNIVVLEVCDQDYEDSRFAGKVKLAYREETQREEYTLTNAVQRIIELNKIFNPRHIYVDRGFGEVQVELLHKYGIEHPETQLRKRVVGVSFSETIEIRDPHTKMPVKKDLKPFMVDNLRQMLEKQQIVFPKTDDEVFRDSSSLYMQLISYVVARTTQLGRPVFEASGTAQDHAHDALILACLAITQNYGDLMKANIARRAIAVNNETFLPVFKIEDENDERIAEQTWGENINDAPVEKKRKLSVKMNRRNPYRPIRRKMF